MIKINIQISKLRLKKSAERGWVPEWEWDWRRGSGGGGGWVGGRYPLDMEADTGDDCWWVSTSWSAQLRSDICWVPTDKICQKKGDSIPEAKRETNRWRWLKKFVSKLLRFLNTVEPAYSYLVCNRFSGITELNLVPFAFISLLFYPCWDRLLLR